MFRPRPLVVAIFVVSLGAASLHAEDVRIPLPKKSKYTPVQKLNRDGVAAVEKHQYDKAKKLFYKAYLIDPDDPFTLNNLGYLAELEGDSDRAQRFYQLSSEQNSDAVIDKASNDRMEGKPVSTVAGIAEDKGIKINRLNNQAIALLTKDRAPEADLVLQKALTIDARNPFTLNNLGYAKEKEGELDSAYQFYTAAANTGSRDRVEVAIDKDWHGREISDVAGNNARKLNRRLRDGGDLESRVALLNLRGVSAMNRNDRRTGRDLIQQAYKLNPNDAFSLNNMGFLAEMDGDRETADYYYDRARDANSRGARITLATRKDVEGKKIGELAENTDNLVLTKIDAEQQARQRMGGPVMLRRRGDNSAIVEPAQPVTPPQPYRVSDANGNLILPPRQNNDVSQPVRQGGGLAMPLPDNQQPTTIHQGQTDGGMIMPLPEDQQPNAQQPASQPKPNQGVIDNGVMMPLADDQQPGAQPKTPQPQQNSRQPKQGVIDNGMIMPLPDEQQPNAQQQPAVQQPLTQQPPTSQPYSNRPATTAPAPKQAPVQTPAPWQNQAQPPAQQQQNPPLLLPLPDNQQPGAQQTPQTQSARPQNNTGVYAPPPAGGTNNNSAKPSKKISDTDPAKAKPSTPTSVKKITDQD
jgi:Flp pilus assembly protein TadD